MWIYKLQIHNFRGLSDAEISFSERQTVLIGPNGSGKSTVIEALALLLGKDRQIKSLTEHDFNGSSPTPADRLRIIATLAGFSTTNAEDHANWFSPDRGVPKWIRDDGIIDAAPKSANDRLCVQIGFCARFDSEELECETLRYFHDDDSVIDPFDDQSVKLLPKGLISDVGFFLIPTQRTWDRLVSFSSDFFRRLLTLSGSLEAAEIIGERDRLRSSDQRIDQRGALATLREALSQHLKQLIPGQPELEFKLTNTDAESILNVLSPHYKYPNLPSLPAARHGSGLLSIQTALLVLEIATRRQAKKDNVIIAVEEPELHMQPGVQLSILQKLRSKSHQLICTSHSPRVAAMYPATDIRIANPGQHERFSALLNAPLTRQTKNAIRKLFQENRQSYVEALMHKFIIVPEGRIDAEWLKLLSWHDANVTEGEESSDFVQFGMQFGIVPTQDSCVVPTIEEIRKVRGNIVALVDGDDEGNKYVRNLTNLTNGPDQILQWPVGWAIEDVVAWILEADDELIPQINEKLATSHATLSDFLIWLKANSNQNGGKFDYLAIETIGELIAGSPKTAIRVNELLRAITNVANGGSQSWFIQDPRNDRLWNMANEHEP